MRVKKLNRVAVRRKREDQEKAKRISGEKERGRMCLR